MDNENDDDTKYFGKLRVGLVGLDIKLRKLIQSSPIYHFSVYPSRAQYIRGGVVQYKGRGEVRYALVGNYFPSIARLVASVAL